MRFGIAGWPLRNLPLDTLREVIEQVPVDLLEIPKDLIDSTSIKSLFAVLEDRKYTCSFAGTTDFSNLSGLAWRDYQRYLDIQISCARFLRCSMVRVFLQAADLRELEVCLDRLKSYSDLNQDIEIVVETHGGFESHIEGLIYFLDNASFRLVVDISNIEDTKTSEYVVSGELGSRIAYFHVRNLPGYTEQNQLVDWETRATQAYPEHTFLWEPKDVSGAAAVKIFRQHVV